MLAFAWRKEDPIGRFAAPEEVGPLASSPDGAFVVAGGASGALYVWETATGSLLTVCKAHYRAVTCACFSVDGSLVFTGSEDALVHVWDLAALVSVGAAGESTRPLRSVTGFQLAITGVCVAGASAIAATSMDRSLRVVEPRTGRALLHAVLPCAPLCVVVDAVAGVAVSGGMDGNVYCHPLNHARPRVLGGHTAPVTCVCLAPVANATVASGSEDGTVRLWNVEFEQAVLVIGAEAPVLFLLAVATVPDAPLGRKPPAAPALRKLKDDEETMRDRLVPWPRAAEAVMAPPAASSSSPVAAVHGAHSKDWQDACARLYAIACDKLVDRL